MRNLIFPIAASDSRASIWMAKHWLAFQMMGNCLLAWAAISVTMLSYDWQQRHSLSGATLLVGGGLLCAVAAWTWLTPKLRRSDFDLPHAAMNGFVGIFTAAFLAVAGEFHQPWFLGAVFAATAMANAVYCAAVEASARALRLTDTRQE